MKNLEPDTPPTAPVWGLQCAITPRLGTRLVQQGRYLQFLAVSNALSELVNKGQLLNLGDGFYAPLGPIRSNSLLSAKNEP